MGNRKGIWHFRAKVVYNQKITVKDVLMSGNDVLFGLLLEHIPFKYIKQLEGRKVNYGMPRVQQFFGDAVGQECLPHACVSVKKQIGMAGVKFTDKFPAFFYSVFYRLQRTLSGCRIDFRFGIIIIGERVKVLVF